MKRLTNLAIGALVLAAAQSACADDFGYIVPYPGQLVGTEVNHVAPMSLGWTFQFRGNYKVFGLGMVDTGAPGFSEVHQVSLWDSGGSRLLSVTVDAFTPSFQGIGMVTLPNTYWLAPGIYTLSASNVGNEDGFVETYQPLSLEPYVRFQSARWAPGSADRFPAGFSDLVRVGPAMWFAVPEPATWLQLIAGFAITGSVLRRRRKLRGAAAL